MVINKHLNLRDKVLDFQWNEHTFPSQTRSAVILKTIVSNPKRQPACEKVNSELHLHLSHFNIYFLSEHSFYLDFLPF